MRRILLVLTLCIAIAFSASASHIYGGELLYSNISGNSYKITLVLYGDCSANPTTFNGLYTATPAISIYNNQSLYSNVSLVPEQGTGYEVTPACSSQINNTACNGGTLPGIKKFVYTNTISLSGTSANWRFVFSGNLASGSQAGRSNNITNVANVGSTLVTLEATLNNLNGGNSSPQYTTIPTPFYCVNTAQQYNQGAIDPNADSLSFSLTPALNNGQTVTYISPFTDQAPISTQPNSFTFSAINGQMSFTPDQQQDALVVNKVYEYRNGILIGTSMREMTFIVFSTCNNHPPSGNVSGTITGGVSLGPNIVGVCQGESMISFNIAPTDPDGDTINLSTIGIPSTATLNVTNNNTPAPSLSFTWNTANVPPGSYSFFVTYKDNGCPLSSQQTQAYTIVITKKPVASFTVPDVICSVDTAQISFTGSAGSAAVYNWDWDNAQYTAGSGAGPYQVLWDTAGVKNISLTVVENQCPSEIQTATVTVKPTPKAVFSYKDICQYDSVTIQYNTPPLIDAQYQWNFDGGITDQNTGIGPHVVHWLQPGDKTIGLKVSLNGCADTTTNKLSVYPQPTVSILNKAETLCYGDKVYLLTQTSGGGAFQYTWTPKAYIFTDPDGAIYTRVLTPTTYVVKGTNEYNCSGEDSIRYDDIRPCCKFSYPDAFTPNGDGRNDGFHIITYGNDLKYELQIFDRWGQKVFTSYNQSDAWDGTLDGKPCEIGTYYYFFKAQCMTGQNEEHKGEITLVR